MNVNEVLQYVDRLVVEKTGKHLDNVQKAVVVGTCQQQTYDDIAKKCHVTEGHVGDVGSELWKFLSEALGEDIKKSNFRSTFERLQLTSLPIIIQNNNQQNNHHTFNFGIPTLHQHNQKYQENIINTKSINHDLKLAPKITKFYDRDSEINTLYNWIFNKNIPLISVLGISGIGKTALVKRFVDLNIERFEIIIWKTLTLTQSLDSLVSDFLNTCQQEYQNNPSANLKQLFDVFTSQKCLIIIDNVENIFIPGQFAGQYQAEYQDYQKFFTMITATQHQSNIILISQQQCMEMESLDEELYPSKCLEISGLNNIDILNNLGLQDENTWLELITLYEGNLMYLTNITALIKKNYDGYVADFLAENTLHITGKMESHFRELFHHLSPQEQEIVVQMSKFEQPVSREELRQSLNLSSVDFNNGLQSLQQRYLVTKIKPEKILFKLSPVFREYVRNCCKD